MARRWNTGKLYYQPPTYVYYLEHMADVKTCTTFVHVWP